jgi:hypothetical protein
LTKAAVDEQCVDTVASRRQRAGNALEGGVASYDVGKRGHGSTVVTMHVR